MSTSIEVPRFWTFHLGCCGAIFGAVVADQRFDGMNPNGPVLVTEQQAWDDFYDGRKRERNADRRRGVYVQPSDNVAALGKHADNCPTRKTEPDNAGGIGR